MDVFPSLEVSGFAGKLSFLYFSLSFDKIIEFSEIFVPFLNKLCRFGYKSRKNLPDFLVFGNKFLSFSFFVLEF